MMAGKRKKPRGTSREGYGILNPYGDMWTTDIFDTVDQAHEHVRRFWNGSETGKTFRYTVVRARQHTTYRGEVTHD